MKIVHRSPYIIAVLLILAGSPAKAVNGPVYHEQPDDSSPAPAPSSAASSSSKSDSVDQIKGIGIFKFGAKVTDFAPGLLQVVDPRAKGVLLRVCPYGDNYLVTDLTGLTWGNIPLAGLIVTFHDGMLIDLQVALKAKKSDLYLADRAFKDKYGSNDPRTLPVETWNGDRIQVTLILMGGGLLDANSLDAPAVGRLELFNQAEWTKIHAAQTAKLKELLDKRYQDDGKKVQSNL